MKIQTVLILVIAVVAVASAVNITVFYRWLRSTAPMDEKALAGNGTVLLIFLVQALVCFKGPFLILQIGAIGVLYALCYLQHMGKISYVTVAAPKKQP